MTNKAFIYCRVSTEKQETERQLRDLRDYCKRNDYEIVEEFQESISATKSKVQRQHLIDAVRKSKAKYFIADDISRFSRNVKVGLEIKDELHEMGVCLVFVQTGMKSLNEDGTPNAMANMVFVSLMNVYEMENSTKRQMIKSGLRNAVANGKTLGRPEGTTEDLLSKYPKVVKLLQNGTSIRNTALLSQKAKSLVQRVKTQMVETELV
jgi:DNA invertase Pin-like site-specific DNA recombinase